jgi:hypothetical protein
MLMGFTLLLLDFAIVCPPSSSGLPGSAGRGDRRGESWLSIFSFRLSISVVHITIK